MNKDGRDILRLLSATTDAVALATVTRTVGSSYRAPGARMLIGARERLAGSVSGGCLERDLVKRASWLTRDGPQRLRFETSADPDEDELHYLGCGGTIEILLEPLGRGSSGGVAIELLRWVQERGEPAIIATVVASDDDEVAVGSRYARTANETAFGRGCQRLFELADASVLGCLGSGASRHAELRNPGQRIDVFLEFVAPTRKLLVVGRHHDVEPVVRIGRMLGWEMTVAGGACARDVGYPDDRIESSCEALRAWAAANQGAAAVVMTHSIALDRDSCGALLDDGGLSYVGLLGPESRANEISQELVASATLDVEKVEALHCPVGLPLGGDGPEAVALSITSEIQAHFEGRVLSLSSKPERRSSLCAVP